MGIFVFCEWIQTLEGVGEIYRKSPRGGNSPDEVGTQETAGFLRANIVSDVRFPCPATKIVF